MSEDGRWIGNERGDGTRIVKGVGGYGVVSDQGVHVWNCPHCGGDIDSATSARLIADRLFPAAPDDPNDHQSAG